jgi:xanthine/uracil permease
MRFRHSIDNKLRLGFFALAISLMLNTFGLPQTNVVHFLHGLFLGMALTLMVASLYQKSRSSH